MSGDEVLGRLQAMRDRLWRDVCAARQHTAALEAHHDALTRMVAEMELERAGKEAAE